MAWLASSWLHGLARAVPALLEFIALTLLYCLIPNCAVRWRDGALGAAIATVAIEILKVGFSIYVGATSFYSTVYGALAIIPIFLLWMYISWIAVLLGAVIAAALPNWRIDERIGAVPAGGVRLGLSLALIAALARAQRRGEAAIDAGARGGARGGDDGDRRAHQSARRGRLRRAYAGGPLGARLEPRERHACTTSMKRCTCRSPAAGRRRSTTPWQRQVAPAMDRIVKAEAAAMQVTIASLLAETLEPGMRRRGRWRSAPPVAEKVASE